MNFTQFIAEHWLDMLTTILGIAYIILEYRASIWLWVVGFFMQSLGIILYYQKGLYADCGMEFYYLAMTIYGFIAWKYTKGPKKKPYSNSDQDLKEGELSQNASDSRVSKSQPEETYAIRTSKEEKPITHFKKSLVLPWIIITLTIWGALYYFLITFTDSKVPIADSFTTALSFVGIWALARKYLERCRHRYLCALLLQGHPFQGKPLWALYSNRLHGIFQMETYDESSKDCNEPAKRMISQIILVKNN